jgi:hypothetical protein
MYNGVMRHPIDRQCPKDVENTLQDKSRAVVLQVSRLLLAFFGDER